MKKLFGRGQKSAAHGPLCNKTVQVGKNTVLCEALLGSGGYADIYRVTDTADGATYALKHLRLAGDPQLIVEVQREAKTQARLKGHPNVLRLHAVAFAGPKGGETDGFFLLDFCPGNLLDLLARHSFVLEQRTVLHIFGCVARAVGHMHAQKPPMAHRDLKAENVLMLPDGTWVLCDFGSTTTRAQVYETAEAMAAEGEVISRHTTPAYRPPEMWDLYQRQLIDTKVDIWALGVLLFVLCFGHLPFAGDSKLQILNGKYEMPHSPNRAPQQLAELRASVLGELEMLRGQVALLSDQNQAFVFRIKQLEDYAQRQEQAVARLNQQLADLQQQQQPGGGGNGNDGMVDAAGNSGAAGVARHGSGSSRTRAAGQAGVAGGSFWSTQSAVL
ncbi:serine/threonine protein kinase 7 [Scenedesmus sp. NREL 46B-D3]|nr:serine/threonine protein kinase 7 [Scenedesmus sp. NREL 46B-D3]